jgi:hypothetical protein
VTRVHLQLLPEQSCQANEALAVDTEPNAKASRPRRWRLELRTRLLISMLKMKLPSLWWITSLRLLDEAVQALAREGGEPPEVQPVVLVPGAGHGVVPEAGWSGVPGEAGGKIGTRFASCGFVSSQELICPDPSSA